MAASGSSSPTSPEYETLQEKYDKLVVEVKQSPESIGSRLFAKGLLTHRQRDEINNKASLKSDRATIIVDAVLDKTGNNPQNFKIFLEALSEEKECTKDIVAELARGGMNLIALCDH